MQPLALNDGSSLPALGFGLYKVEPEATTDVVVAGVEAGYRLVDGAEFYHNEPQVGEALRRVDRAGLTVTSKFWGEESQSRDAVMRAFDGSERAFMESLHPARAESHLLGNRRPRLEIEIAELQDKLLVGMFHLPDDCHGLALRIH